MTLSQDEERLQAADRKWDELLGELRVVLTGVAVLFSVLLTIPFSARFDEVTASQRHVYFTALLLTAASNVALVAPVSFHRLVFQRGQKSRVVAFSSALAVAGLVLLLLAVTAVLLLVSDVLFASAVAVVVSTAFGTLTAALWFLPPLVARLRHPEPSTAAGSSSS